MTGSLPVHLFGAAIGRIERAGSTSLVFSADHEGLDVYGVGSTVLSTSLSFSAAPSPAGASTNFFGGLLPEGRRRTNLAKQAGVESTDTFGMLDYAGWDLPGAVNVGMDPGQTAEHVPASVSDVERLHQEDSAQALGLPWDGDAKYEAVDHRATLTNIAGLLPAVRKRSLSQGDRYRLLSCTTFNAAIGNTDAHAKNFSILHFRDGKVGLAPLYDVTALALAPDGQQNLALRVNGVSYQPAVTVEHLVNEGTAWGIPEPAARAQVKQTLEKLFDAVSTVDPLEAGERIGRYISLQVRNLLDGKPAAVSSEPACLARF